MKTIYNILAMILGTFLFILIFPVIYAVAQLIIFLLFFVAEILILPICIYLVYMAWTNVKNRQKNTN
jgi:membrane protein implicated in regulation of membrane protease activity